MMHPFAATIIITLMLAGWTACTRSDAPENVDPVYLAEIDAWHQQRIAALTRPTGWLSLAGLFWLKEGENRFGSDPANEIVFPADKAPGLMGWFYLRNAQVTVKIAPGVTVTAEGAPVTEMPLRSDAEDRPTVLTHGSLSWYVIQRGERIGIRLRDSENPRLKAFKGIERYPVSPQWRIPARWVPYDPPKKIPVPNVLGTVYEEDSPGALEFVVDGQTCRLDAIAEPGDTELFVIFADPTNGAETYGAGRFLYVPRPDSSGFTYIDFNKAYNPPCVFTEFATCPLPPAENRLPVRITAGEKNYADAVH